jgi:hypothetical protein
MYTASAATVSCASAKSMTSGSEVAGLRPNHEKADVSGHEI